VAWNDLLGHHQLGLFLSLTGLGSREGEPHADEAAARWRENTSSFDFEEVAAAASLEAAARAMGAELGKPYVVLGSQWRKAETTRKNRAGF